MDAHLGARVTTSLPWRATMAAMATRPAPLSHDPVLEALARAPIGEPLTPEQRAELDQDLADIAAGRARLIRHEDMPSVLEELARGQSE